MITETEKQFFKSFGIEPKIYQCNWQCQKPSKLIYLCDSDYVCEYRKEYPVITDTMLLQLIDVLLKFLYVGVKKGTDFYEIDIQGWIGTKGDTLKEAVLQMFINISKTDFKEVVITDVQEIFKER